MLINVRMLIIPHNSLNNIVTQLLEQHYFTSRDFSSWGGGGGGGGGGGQMSHFVSPENGFDPRVILNDI